MFDYPYLIEILTPKRDQGEKQQKLLDRFAERFTRVIAAGCGVSIPDNPMGQLRIGALEAIERQGLVVDPERLMLNLNTFHRKDELDTLLATARRLGVRYLLVVRGDGGPLLPKLDPKSIGGTFNVASSADLISFINKEYPGQFVTGAAFNHYNPVTVELNRLESKAAAGAKFVVTQPVVGEDSRLDQLKAGSLPLVVEAWMSDNLALFSRSVGDDSLENLEYQPHTNLKVLHEHFPDSCIYLSMLDFKEEFERSLPRLG